MKPTTRAISRVRNVNKTVLDIVLHLLVNVFIRLNFLLTIALPSEDLSSNFRYLETRQPKNEIPEKAESFSTISNSIWENIKQFCNMYTYHIAGWGVTAEITEKILENEKKYILQFKNLQENAKVSENLRELELDIAPNDSCFGYFDHLDSKDKELENSHRICAQSFKPLEEGACFGDSGSPLMKFDHVSGRIEVIGIASRISKTTINQRSFYTCNEQSFYTRITKFLPWIHQNLHEFDPKNVVHINYNIYEAVGKTILCWFTFLAQWVQLLSGRL